MAKIKRPSYAKKYVDYEVLIVKEGSMSVHPVFNIDGGTIETDTDVLYETNAIKLFNETNNSFTYVFNMDLPAKVESEDLKLLRRNVAIKNIMSFDKETGIDLKLVMAYLVAVCAVIFA